MAQEWFYTRDGKEKIGPLSSSALKGLARSGKLLPTDIVYKAGASHGKPAAKIKGLFDTSEPDRLSAPASVPLTSHTRQEHTDSGIFIVDPSPRKWSSTKATALTAIIAGGTAAAFLLSCLVCAGIGQLVSGRPSGAISYNTIDSISRDFDEVYRRKDSSSFPFDADEVIVAVRGSQASVYWKSKVDDPFQQLSSASFTAKKKESVESGGILTLTNSWLSQSFDNGVVTIKWSYSFKDSANFGIGDEVRDFEFIALNKCERLK